MPQNDGGLLAEVQRDALNPAIPIADALRKLVALGGQAGSTRLREWASLELRGYRDNDVELPAVSLYWVLSAPALSGVLDRIRTTLVELVAEMRAEMPDSSDTPSSEVADRAVQIVVHGQNVNVTAATATGSGSHQVNAGSTFVNTSRVETAWPALREELSGLGVPDEDLEILHTAFVSDGDPTSDELGEITSSWIGRLSTKVANGTVALAGTASTEVVIHAILKALGLSST